MMTDQFLLPFSAELPDILTLALERDRFSKSVLAENTRKAYAYDWKRFTRWCAECGRSALPASGDTVAFYVTARIGKGRVSSAYRYVSAIAHGHRERGFPAPFTEHLWRLLNGAQRIRCEQPRQKAPLRVRDIQEICAFEAGDIKAIRDRAILLFGFASALRRSNIVDLDLGDIELGPQGVLVKVRKEKQDQLGVGRQIGVPAGQNDATCPVLAVRAWLEKRGDWPGPLFTHISVGRAVDRRVRGRAVCSIVKAAAKRIGLDPHAYGAHSLRAGFVTEALERGVNEILVAAQTGHRSLATLRRYFRTSDPFRANAAAALGL